MKGRWGGAMQSPHWQEEAPLPAPQDLSWFPAQLLLSRCFQEARRSASGTWALTGLTGTVSCLCSRSSVIITGHQNLPQSPTGRSGSTC